jgi:rod shape-determining protein MreC
MYRLIEFFYQYRAFLFFVFLETVCIWLIVGNNNYQGAAFLNSSNSYVAGILETKTNVQDYFRLKRVNNEVSIENARLKKLLTIEEQKKIPLALNNSAFLHVNKYEFISAKVINNSTAHFNNYLTLDKGKLDGIKQGMGIVSSLGIIGRINNCSDHFSTGLSVLNRKFEISGKIKNKNIDCNIKWDGKNPQEAEVGDITRHHKLTVGDTIVTSGYNTFFPAGIMIGKIKEFKPEGGSFWKARVDLSVDFSSLSYVYIIGNKMEEEQDSLEIKNNKEDSHERQ